MHKAQVRQLLNTFLSRYDAEAKDSIWAKQSRLFRDFWNDKIVSRQQRELDNAAIDQVVRILDKNGKGNTKDSEAIAKAMIPQGAWRRLFNEIKASKELSGTMNAIFTERDPDIRAKQITKLYELNSERRNNLTGQSGNAINAMLAAFDPIHNLSVISLKHRRALYDFLDIDQEPALGSADIGRQIVLSNHALLDYFAALGTQQSARTISVFLYVGAKDEPERVPLPVRRGQG